MSHRRLRRPAPRAGSEPRKVQVLEESLRELRLELASCRDEIGRRKLHEEVLHRTAHDLHERVKELKCLYDVASLTQDRKRPLPELVHGVLDALIGSYQFPEITCARVTIGRQVHCTEPFTESRWRQAEDIFPNGRKAGSLEVFYREQTPEADDGPFLKEERALLGAVAELLGRSLQQRREWTARLRMEEALRRANSELQQFAYVASHDLKAPLRAVSNLSTFLEEDLGPQFSEQGRDYLQLLRERVRSMDELIDGLLAYSRAGGKLRHVEPVDTGQLVRDVVSTREVPDGFRIRIGGQMPTVVTDPTRLQQVFANLIENAIKYHNSPDGHVDVSGCELGDFCEFLVMDDGPGIPPEFHERIFEMLQRGPNPEKEGSGMGLAVVKKVVEGAGGHITLRSVPGQGSTFRFTWPKVNREEHY